MELSCLWLAARSGPSLDCASGFYSGDVSVTTDTWWSWNSHDYVVNFQLCAKGRALAILTVTLRQVRLRFRHRTNLTGYPRFPPCTRHLSSHCNSLSTCDVRSDHVSHRGSHGSFEDTSLAYGACAGSYSKYYDVCAASCGAWNQNGCMVIELVCASSSTYPSTSATIANDSSTVR